MSIYKKPTGYASIDKPWLKYYSEEAINAPLPECTIYEYLVKNNKNHLGDIALDYFDRKITYRTLLENIEKAANSFSTLGLVRGDVVIMATVTIPETIYAFYALNKIGVVPNMVDPRTSVDGLRAYIKEVDAKYVLALDACYPKMLEASKGTNVKKIVVTSPADSLPVVKKAALTIANRIKEGKQQLAECAICWKDFIKTGEGTTATTVPYKKDTCCVIVHTGGTTGTPKGVMLSNENLNASVVQCDKSGFNFQRHHKWLGVMPPFIAYGIGNGLHLPLSIGMTLIVLPKFDPNKYDELLLKYKPNHIAGVPSHYNTIIHSKKLKNTDLSFLLSPIVGGDGAEVHFEEEVNQFLNSHNCPTNLIKGYGMTEVCAAISATARNEFNKLGSVGIPFTHSVMGVFEDGKELPIGQTGEICMRAPHVMMGYYGNEEETKHVLKQHDDGYVWVHSGDLGHIDEDGCVFIQGRIKRMIVRFDGFKVYPTLIESVVIMHPAVKACCTVGAPDKTQSQGKLPLVYVVLDPAFNGKKAEIRKVLIDLCHKELPEYAQPTDFRFKEALPLTAIGKVDYRALEKEAEKE